MKEWHMGIKATKRRIGITRKICSKAQADRKPQNSEWNNEITVLSNS